MAFFGKKSSKSSSTQPQNVDDIPPAELEQFDKLICEAQERYFATGDPSVLKQLSEYWTQLLKHPAFAEASIGFQASSLNDAGNHYLRLFERFNTQADLRKAADLCKAAVKRSSPTMTKYPLYLTNLGNVMIVSYRTVGDLKFLENGIKALRHAVKCSTPKQEHYAACINNLSHGLYARYKHARNPSDLDEAIQLAEKAVKALPPKSPELVTKLTNLGNGLSARFALTRKAKDLEKALKVYQQALDLISPTSPMLPTCLNNLASGYYHKFSHKGNIADLNKAIELLEEVVNNKPTNSISTSLSFSNSLTSLSKFYGVRYMKKRSQSDLEAAIRWGKQAVEHTHPDSPEFYERLANYGYGIREKYYLLLDFDDLFESNQIYRQVISRIDPTSPELPMYLNLLGSGLSYQYDRTQDQKDLDEAFELYKQAVKLTPRDSPDMRMYLKNLAQCLKVKADVQKSEDNWDDATVSYLTALKMFEDIGDQEGMKKVMKEITVE